MYSYNTSGFIRLRCNNKLMVIQISRYAGKNCLLSSNCRLKYVDFLSGNGDTVDLAELYPRSNPDCRNDANKRKPA